MNYNRKSRFFGRPRKPSDTAFEMAETIHLKQDVDVFTKQYHDEAFCCHCPKLFEGECIT